MEVRTPPNTKPRIDTLWAYVSVDDHGEGLCGALIGGQWMSLTTTEEANLPFLRMAALDVARLTRRQLRLVKFTTREDVEEVNP